MWATLAKLEGLPAHSLVFYAAVGCVLAGLCIILWVAFALRRPRAGDDGIADDGSAAPTGTVREAERLLRLMGEAEEQAARLTQDYRALSERLSTLIQEADGRIAVLQRGMDRPAGVSGPPLGSAHTPQQTSGRLGDPVGPGSDAPGGHPRIEIVTRPVPSLTGTSELAAAGLRAASIPASLVDLPESGIVVDTRSMPAPSIGRAPTAQAESGRPSSPEPAPASTAARTDAAAEALAESIYRLADQGLTASDIAQRLHQQVGTVELVLALRQ